MNSIEQTIETLRSLNESIPNSLRLPSASDVEAMEQELGVTFNKDYRAFLLKASDETAFWKRCTRAQVINDLKASGKQLGLPIRFDHYPKIEHERFVDQRIFRVSRVS